MKNIPTAEEFFRKFKHTHSPVNHHLALIEFAKLHVEACKKEISKSTKINLFVRPDRKGSKYKLVESGESYDIFETRQMYKVDKESILNAYPLTNIK